MANEEQRRAFESYMGRSGNSNAQPQNPTQPVNQYPGSVAQPGNPYLYQVSPPTAPTPPPAAPSSVASYPGYQGGYPHPGYALGAYGPNGIPQRPPPLGDPQAQQGHQGQQQTSIQGGLQGYTQAPASYNALPPPPLRHNSWSYDNRDSQMSNQHQSPAAGAMVPAYRHAQEVVRSRSRHRREEYHYDRRSQSQSAQAPPVEEVVVPVMLCHTCSHCGKMRSAGFHRNNPVLPGKTLVPTPCRRCKKKLEGYRSSSVYTRIRKCHADEPCNWPREPFRAHNDQDEDRGRRRTRNEYYMERYHTSHPRVIRRESSQAHLGLRALQRSPTRERSIRTSSSTPPSSRRTSNVWPPPDIVRLETSYKDRAYPAPPEPLPSRATRSDEVWPPPDIVRTQPYIHVEKRPLRRQSSRIIELSPSPPPSRPRSSRVVYQNETLERRARSPSISPVRVASRKEGRNEEVEARVPSHHLPYRTVASERRRSYRASDETSSTAEPPTCSVPKPGSSGHHESRYYRRSSVRESEDSLHVEVGGPRVHFGSDRKSEAPESETRGRTSYVKEDLSREKRSEQYRNYSRSRPLHESRPASRQGRDYEQVRTRHYSASRGRDYDDELRMDKQRRISPSPSPALRSREYEEIRVRHISPLPIHRSTKTPPPPSSTSSSHPPPPLYRHVSSTKSLGRKSSVASPPPTRSRHSDDYTDSDSARSGDVTVVRSWKGIDECGRPTTFVEERKERRMLAEGSEDGGSLAREYRNLGSGERRSVSSRVWRDV